MEDVWVCKTIYLPALCVGIFLGGELTPMEAHNCIWVSILDYGVDVDFHPLIYWIWVDLIQKSVQEQTTPLGILWTTYPLMDKDLIFHHHHDIVKYLPDLDLALSHTPGSLIKSHICQIMVDISQNRE